MKKVTGYLGSQFGFSETGRHVIDTLIKPGIERIGIQINDPFVECGKELDINHVLSLRDYDECVKYWAEFSRKVTPINNRLMGESDCLLPILDGGHAVDDGVASEIGYYAAIGRGPIFALRSDFRRGENIAVSINPQLLGYILLSDGYLAEGQNAIDKWFSAIKRWHDSFIGNRQ